MRGQLLASSMRWMVLRASRQTPLTTHLRFTTPLRHAVRKSSFRRECQRRDRCDLALAIGRSDGQTSQESWSSPVEEGIGIPPAGSRREHLLQGDVADEATASKSTIGDRLRARHPESQKAETLIACNTPESDVRTWQTKVVRREVDDWCRRADFRAAIGFMHQRLVSADSIIAICGRKQRDLHDLLVERNLSGIPKILDQSVDVAPFLRR